MAKKPKREKFSVVKAIKSNARDRVGRPKPGRAIDDRPLRESRKSKHKQTLGRVLAED
jgi:hypothetical protein